MLPEPNCYLTINKYLDLIENKKPLPFFKKSMDTISTYCKFYYNAENNTSKINDKTTEGQEILKQ
jgi:hypothetical protein